MEVFAILIVVTSLWVLIDARSIGVRKGLISGMGNMGPWAWFLGCLGLWILAFPLYLAKRGAFKQAIAQSAQPSASSSKIEQLERLAQLKEKGAITAEEFETQKKELLAAVAASAPASGQASTPWFAITLILVVGGLALTWYVGSGDLDKKALEELEKAQPGSLRPDVLLFAETPSRMIVTTRDEARLRAAAHRHGVPCARLGAVGGERVTLVSGTRVLADASVRELFEAWMSLEKRLGGAA